MTDKIRDSSYLSYEVKAEAFRIMTGMVAPGKDSVLAQESMSARFEAFENWLENNSQIINAMILAVDRVMEYQQ